MSSFLGASMLMAVLAHDPINEAKNVTVLVVGDSWGALGWVTL